MGTNSPNTVCCHSLKSLTLIANILLVSVLGPQLRFPVPEGILNHRGENTLALSISALGPQGGKLYGLALVVDGVMETSMNPV